jgi:hypothetical protein
VTSDSFFIFLPIRMVLFDRSLRTAWPSELAQREIFASRNLQQS